MRFFSLLFLFLLSSVVYANDIKIKDTFANLNKICIYNSTNSKIKAYLEDKSNSGATVSESLEDFSGVIEEKSGTGKVTIEPDNLRTKVIYYKLYLSGPRTDNYYLHISGDNDGIIASRCPSAALAKISNATPAGIANAALIAGVLVGFIFFAGVVWAFIPNHLPEEPHDYYN